MFDIDPTSPVPLYLQIVAGVRRMIALGALKSGDRLPAIRDLAVRARVNRNTAARAVQRMESEGLVRTRVGQGTFIDATERPAGKDSAVDAMIDRLVVDAHAHGVPLERLGARVSKRIEMFRRQRDATRSADEERS